MNKNGIESELYYKVVCVHSIAFESMSLCFCVFVHLESEWWPATMDPQSKL